MSMQPREQVIDQLAKYIAAISLSHPIRVAIDGIDAAGKTHLADELMQPLQARGRVVIRASVDDFQRPRVERYRQGKLSPHGYYDDAFDYLQLRSALLAPLGPQGNRRYRRAVFDYHTDLPLDSLEEEAPPDAILLCDGVFLLRPELTAMWEYRIFVAIDFVEGLRRALLRDSISAEEHAEMRQSYQQRYYVAQRSYLQTVHPQEQADIVFGNQDVLHPTLHPKT
jgi:uridine kinase